MIELDQIKDTEQYRDKVSTIDEAGKRVWLYPKKVSGRFFEARTYVSWVLLAFLFGMPFIKVGGEPLLLFNILERKFIIFGLNFAPQDFHLFVLAMIIGIVFITLFTVVFGRLFCGWICPQTIFMEMVYRKIEYWIEGDAGAQKKLNKAAWTTDKIVKKVSKQAIFFAIAVLIANTFLAYIISIDEVMKIIREPITQNWQGFSAMILFSGAFYFVFARMREQVCIAICPYGRLQSVLLDQDSIVVHYDHVRGEPRGRIRRNKKSKKQRTPPKPSPCSGNCSGNGCNVGNALEAIAAIPTLDLEVPKVGDCIACDLCVKVCPTGIDIRNGTQLECINCTACMDACDSVMTKVGREKGLIRYDSYNGITAGRKKIFTTRVIAYTVLLSVLLIVEGFLLSTRTPVEVLLLRTPGMLYQKVDENTISNLYNYQIINKTNDDLPIEFVLRTEGTIKMVGKSPKAAANTVTEGALFIEMPKSVLESRKTKIHVKIMTEGEELDQVKTNFLGPVK
ncbi:MAG: 4Fe-4S dicluster domain-containing protein [Bacteroidota bacterium]